MSTDHRPEVRLKASSPADLLDVIGFLVGFTPEESVVLAVLRDSQVALTARLDLPPPGVGLQGEDVARRLTEIAEEHRACGVVVFTFSTRTASARAVLRRCAEALAPYGVVDAIHADGHRWWSEVCGGGCCGPDGTPYDAVSGPLAAAAVYAGLVRRTSRSEIEALVLGPGSEDHGDLDDLLAESCARWSGVSRAERCRRIDWVVDTFLDAPRPLSDAEVIDLAVLATDHAVRDVAWTMMSRERAEDHLDLWQQVVDRAVGPLVAPALSLLGMAGWISGQGALVVCCIERLEEVDPGYTLGELLADINRRGLPPTAWDLLAVSLRNEAGPRAAW